MLRAELGLTDVTGSCIQLRASSPGMAANLGTEVLPAGQHQGCQAKECGDISCQSSVNPKGLKPYRTVSQ